jgi:hypothetical protein
MGFLTGLIFLTFTILSYFGLRKFINRTKYGGVLGASSVLLMVALQASIFWGQYSNCDVVSQDMTGAAKKGYIGVECSHPTAMSALCAFSVLLFLSHLLLIVVLLLYKEQLLGAEQYDEGFSAHAASSFTFADSTPGGYGRGGGRPYYE